MCLATTGAAPARRPLARKGHACSEEHVGETFTGGHKEQRGAELPPEGGGEILRLLAVVPVALQQQPRAVLSGQPLLHAHCARAELTVGGDSHGEDDGGCRAQSVQRLSLGECGEQRVAVELGLMHRHQPGGLHVLALLAGSLALARERQLCLELRGAGGVHRRGVIPDLLPRGQERHCAVQPQPRAILDRLQQLLHLAHVQQTFSCI